MKPSPTALLTGWRRLRLFIRRRHLGNALMLGLLGAAVLAGIATYAVLTEGQPFNKHPSAPIALLLVDLLLFFLLGSFIVRRIFGLVIRQRQGRAGSGLQLRVIAVFSALAITPAILVAVFAALFFVYGVQSWFGPRVKTAVDESLAVAQAYLAEHQQVIRGDILGMANDLNRAANSLTVSKAQYQAILSAQVQVRNLSEATVFDGGGHILAQSGLALSLDVDPVSDKLLEQARGGDVVVLLDDENDRVRALMQIDRTTDLFLYVGRPIDQKVLDHTQAAQGAVAEYKTLEARRQTLQWLVVAIFIVVALLLLAVAVWLGLNFANRLVGPISALIEAADRVASGDWNAKVAERRRSAPDELTRLSRAFNRMTAQLESQRLELATSNRQLDARRIFTEAVLSGVSAGVIGIDAEGSVTLPNQAASELLALPAPAMIGQKLATIMPEVAPLLASRDGSRGGEAQIELIRAGRTRTLLVRLTAELDRGAERGRVVTFDDVSDLVTAQRQAAWADVAKRIAHEIKNPLTPIQLSAERLQRRYAKAVEGDAEVFKSCTDTIIRQVGDIGRMVDEFSAFARMPAPQMKSYDLAELIKQAVFLTGTANETVTITTDLKGAGTLTGDSRQVAQALTNVLKNGIESIEGRDGDALAPGEIKVTIRQPSPDLVDVIVSDNGRGLPKAERARLTEPYVTTREKGTGLGLAIVKKILEDHGGGLMLEDNDSAAPGISSGARVTLRLARQPALQDAA